MHEILGQYGIAGAILLIVFLLGKSAINHIGIPLMKAHVAALQTWQDGTIRLGHESGEMTKVMSGLQATQVEIHLAVAAFTEQLGNHIAKRQEYDARILAALDRLVTKIDARPQGLK